MENKEIPKLHIQTLGGFSISYDGNSLTEEFRENSQFTLLVLTILHFRKTGVERNLLVRMLFPDEQVDDISHSLRNAFYTARKKLKEMGLPDVDYFRREKKRYYWTEKIPVEEDAEQFDQFLSQLLPMGGLVTSLQQALTVYPLYKGTFLPRMSSVEWIAEEAERLRHMFGGLTNMLQHLCREQRCFQELYEVGLHACSAEPFEKWEPLVVEALVALDRYDEAEQFYQKTVERYTEHYGSRNVKAVQDLVEEIGHFMLFRNEEIESIQNRLTSHEESGYGGFYCNFPVFQEMYRTVERVMKRYGGYVYLMLCTMVDSSGIPLEGDDYQVLSEYLQDVLIHSVRNTDTITRYGKGQFLVLLIGLREENCSIVSSRIEEGFGTRENIHLQFEFRKISPYMNPMLFEK